MARHHRWWAGRDAALLARWRRFDLLAGRPRRCARVHGGRAPEADRGPARPPLVITQSYGSGSPVTLVAHGLGATAGEARIPASGLPGTRVVVTLPSHGS